MPRPYNVININGHIVPATRHDAIKKILHDVSTGRIGTSAHGRYRALINPTCMCAIGTFFTDEQLDQIVNARDNRQDVRGLAHAIGRENLEAMTGLEVGVARVIQSDFDFFTAHCSSGALHGFADRMRRELERSRNVPNPATAHTGAWHFPVSEQ